MNFFHVRCRKIVFSLFTEAEEFSAVAQILALGFQRIDDLFLLIGIAGIFAGRLLTAKLTEELSDLEGGTCALNACQGGYLSGSVLDGIVIDNGNAESSGAGR